MDISGLVLLPTAITATVSAAIGAVVTAAATSAIPPPSLLRSRYDEQ